MPLRTTWTFLLLLALLPAPLEARVVINEIFYHAPDDLEDLAYIELHNTGEDPVELSGWSFTRGIQFKFPAGVEIDAGGFVVLCRNADRLKEFYGTKAAGVFESKLSAKGERIELSDARGRMVDAVKYQDGAPWPLGADGLSGSLERICPEAGADNPANWSSSPLSSDRIQPTGSPGKTNSCFAPVLPPIVSAVTSVPEHPRPTEAMTVEATVRDAKGVGSVMLLYRIAGPGFEKPESTLAMKEISPGRYAAEIPGQSAGQLIRYRVQAVGTSGARRLFPSESEPRPAFSSYVHAPVEAAMIPFAWIINTTEPELRSAQKRVTRMERGGNAGEGFRGPLPWRGGNSKEPSTSLSAFVCFDPATNRLEVFDFVEVESRKGGQKVHFAKGQSFREMSTINLTFESAVSTLAEPLAYEVYRRAGMAVAQSGHLRLWLNGSPAGYHAFVEQANRAFLRRNKINDNGNLYKLIWYGNDVVDQHEKKTRTGEGHDDLLALLDALKKDKGDAQWEVIKKQFDVEQVVNYFAVNTVLSHWDGFFNNYFTYHDVDGTGRWTMYPWDQDQTWGITGMMGRGEVLFDMPLTFGMAGDREADSGGRWWRPPGYFSGPLLANAQFRKFYLARTKQILETIYTKEVFGLLLDDMARRLRPEVKFRAESFKSEVDAAARQFEEHISRLREHLTKRREFLLAQPELKAAGPFSTEGLEKPAKKKEKKTKP